jgi:glycosyltransferase involved in cell wall biosynthesis
MRLRPGFAEPLFQAFRKVPDLFCATAQIYFPEGARREETGKAVMPARESDSRDTSFPVRCEIPLAGEDLSYVLYGSGGCSVYDTSKLQRLGGFGEMYRPAYVEDLDAGYRAWQRHWPTVFVAGAQVVHHHRATTSRFYSDEELELVLDINYLRFLVRAVASPRVFRRLWKQALWRLNLKGAGHFPSFIAAAALGFAARAPRWLERPPANVWDEDLILGVGSGALAVFPGRSASGNPVVMVCSPYLPFPLSHGGAVRMYNLMRRASGQFDQVLVAFADELATPPLPLLGICSEIVLIKRTGSHFRPTTARPDVVEEFDSPAFHAAVQLTVRRWKPVIAQLEFTQMAQYAADCAPAKTLLAEHDITFDLYEQLLATGEDWEVRRQLGRWQRFEAAAWRQVDRVITMSDKDRARVKGARAVTLPNGVDLERFRPSQREPEPGRLLFIGSFAHLPNLLAVRFFLEEVWPRLAHVDPVLHIIAGSRHKYFLDRYRDRAGVNLDRPRIEVEDFVADVRPAYERATLVVAPLLASAGTNIKIMEAMAMGKAIVSTRAGVNGLDVETGRDVIVVEGAVAFAEGIDSLLSDEKQRRSLEAEARRTAAEKYNWDAIAREQEALYRELIGS